MWWGRRSQEDKSRKERRVRCLFLAGRDIDAIRLATKLVREYPDDGRLAFLLAEAYANRGNFEAAISLLATAARLDPDAAAIHDALGMALTATQRLEQGLWHFGRACELAPTFEHLANFATAALAVGRHEAAAPALLRCRERGPGSPQIYAMLAVCELRRGNVNTAKAMAAGVMAQVYRSGGFPYALVEPQLEEIRRA